MSLDGGWIRLKKHSDEQRKGWYIAGTVYGACVLLAGHQAGALTAGPAQTLCKPFVRPRWSNREDD
jgi:hypothetical protein